MKSLRYGCLLALTLILAVLLIGCGGTTATNNQDNKDQAMSGKNDNKNNDMNKKNDNNMQSNGYGNNNMDNGQGNMGGNNGGMTTAPMGGDMNAFIHTAKVTIMGDPNPVNVLTDNKGFMLYYYKRDPLGQSICTGQCAQAWPPLLAPAGMMTVTASMQLPKQLTVQQTANGNQVFYDGHALYKYAGDMGPGQFNGRGVNGVWYLAGLGL